MGRVTPLRMEGGSMRFYLRLTSIFLTLLSFSLPARADILLLKNGDIIECKILKVYKAKPPQGGSAIEYMEVRFEDGKKKTYRTKQIADFLKKKPSWEVRKTEKEWYAKESLKLAGEEDWKKQERFGLKCKNYKKYLDEEALVHLQAFHRGLWGG